MQTTGTKTCKRCGVEKPLDDFWHHTTPSRDGSKAWRYPQSNCLACEKIVKAGRYQKNRVRDDANHRRWGQQNPDRYEFSRAQTSARHRGVTEFMSFEEWCQISAATVCHWCGLTLHRSFRNIDHIRPVAFGGQHTADNVVMACANCNARREWERKTKKEVS